jgi:predicted transcriptional regulator
LLLEQQFADENAEKLSQAVKQLRDLNTNLVNTLKSGGMPKTGDDADFTAEMPDDGEINGLKMVGGEELADKLEEINGKIASVQQMQSTLLSAIGKIVDNLQDAMDKVESDPDYPKDEPPIIGAIGDMFPDAGFPTMDKLITGMKNATSETPDYFQDAWNSASSGGNIGEKVVSFFSSLFGKGKSVTLEAHVDIDGMIDEILELTIPQVRELRDALPLSQDQAQGQEIAQLAVQGSAVAAVEGGEGAEDGGEAGEAGRAWVDVAKAIAAAAEDRASAESVLNTLTTQDAFKDVLKDKVVFAEGRSLSLVLPTRLKFLLFEAVSFEELVKMGGLEKLGDEVNKEKVFVDIASALNKEIGEDIVTDIPEIEETSPDEPPPATEEEGVEEQEDAQAELTAAAQDAAQSGDSPGVAIMATLDDWVAGLSPTSQQSLQAKDRIGGLKTNIQTALDSAADTLAKSVGDAVGQWRSEHEETLIKSRRFAKKNFDSLEQVIPQIAQTLLKKTNETRFIFTHKTVKRLVYKFLDKKFRMPPVLSEHLFDHVSKNSDLLSLEFIDETISRWKDSIELINETIISRRNVVAYKKELQEFFIENCNSKSSRKNARIKITKFLSESSDLSKMMLRKVEFFDLAETFILEYCNMREEEEHSLITENTNDVYYNEDDLIMYRWRRMAKIYDTEE